MERFLFVCFLWIWLILVDQVVRVFLRRVRATWRGGAVAPLVMGFAGFSSGWDYFYVRCVGLVRAGVSLRAVAMTMAKGATAPSANRFAEPAWRTHKKGQYL